MPRSTLLARDLSRALAGRRVLDAVSLTVSPGQRIGVIGENGIGKSTLLRLLAGVDKPDAGTVEGPDDLGFLEQELAFDPSATIADVVADALRESRTLLAELERLGVALAAAPSSGELLAEYGAVLEAAQARGVWDAEREAAVVMAGIGLADESQSRTLGSISGGQRARLALAAQLIRRPSALVLDEPTNHLDDTAVAFVEQRLRELPGVVVFASHDRALLDAVATDIVDLDPSLGGPTRFGGNYSAYVAAKRAERERWQRRYDEQQDELITLRESASVTAHHVAHDRPMRDNDLMGYGRRSQRVEKQLSSRVRSATRRLDELTRRQVPPPPPVVRFEPTRLTRSRPEGPLVTLTDVQVDGRLAPLSLALTSGAHLLVTGPNGAGKSTLLAVLAGRLAPSSGSLERRRGLRVGLLTQDTLFDRPDLTAVVMYERALGVRAERVPLSSLGLLSERDASTPVGGLSVGQRRRLALALLVADPPDLLLLDEPTNHLSPALADELEDAFESSPGAIVVASHDRWLRRRWAWATRELEP